MRVLITGATSGIGRALALDYAGAGADVVAFGRDEARLEAGSASRPAALPSAWKIPRR
jgi:NAD(P)-dependent dehydrogenase (short-subunit alcohol dehydrogenase family)